MRRPTEIIAAIKASRASIEFMKTGFVHIDDHLDGGFMRKELVVLGGSTGSGKSYLAGQIMLNIAQLGFKCGYFSLEISAEMIMSRLLGALSNIKPTSLIAEQQDKWLSEELIKAEVRLQLADDFIEIHDELYMLDDIVKQIQEHAYDFVVIDFIQNVMTKGEDEYTRMTHVSLALQQLAKAQNCTILTLSQVSNTVARENTSKVIEYKGSGAIAMVCDLGFTIQREDYVEGTTHQGLILTLRKNRRGISGYTFPLGTNIPGGAIYEA